MTPRVKFAPKVSTGTVEVFETPVYLIPGGESFFYEVDAPGIAEQFIDPDEAYAFAQHISACTGFAISDLRSL